MKRLNSYMIWVVSMVPAALFFADGAYALPGFAQREGLSCTVCHTNGSAPHLTKTGYMYRRAGFRFPGQIGDTKRDDQALSLNNHVVVGLNADYEFVESKSPGNTGFSVTSNNFNVPEIELWPLVGGFLGNFGAWSEIDGTPNVAGSRNSLTPPGVPIAAGGAVTLSQADIRYVYGHEKMFLNFRTGLIAPEGYGASDQWIDDGQLPLIDLQTAQFNQDTLVLPLGAMGVPELGAEIGLNYYQTFLTLGAYNGFDGSNGYTNGVQSTLTPNVMNPDAKMNKDFKVQVDQFLWEDRIAFTAVYYNGHISLLDPNNNAAGSWVNDYNQLRLYPMFQLIPNVVDLLAGGAWNANHWVQPGSTPNNVPNWGPSGSFRNWGGFFGANWYAIKHLTLSGRYDYLTYAYNTGNNLKAQGFELMASAPFDNNLFIFHYNNVWSDITGGTRDFRLDWRFLF